MTGVICEIMIVRGCGVIKIMQKRAQADTKRESRTEKMIESLKNGFLRVLIMNSYSEFIEQIFISMFDLIEKHNNICNKIQRITSY